MGDEIKFTDKTAMPPEGINYNPSGIGPPKRLWELLPKATEFSFDVPYTPADVSLNEIRAVIDKLYGVEDQTIAMIFGNPVCAVSRSYKCYPAKNIVTRRGHLSKFESHEFETGEQPETTIAITFSEDHK